MIDRIEHLDDSTAHKILNQFMSIYLEKGFGMMNKTEIETLLYHILRENELLTGKCFDDSLSLKIPESRARKLIYDSEIKYKNRTKEELDIYLRRSVGKLLETAYFANDNKSIKFALEDKYLRVALNAKLRANNFFADTSFNRDIVSLDVKTLAKLIELIVPTDMRATVIDNMHDYATDESTTHNFSDAIQSILNQLFTSIAIKGIQHLGKLLLT